MGLDDKSLQVLRECCRDDAAFQRLCAMLADYNSHISQSEAHYRALLAASPDLMFRIDAKGYYLDFNSNGISDIPREAIVGKQLGDVLPPDVAALCQQAIRRALETGQLQTCSYPLSEPSGTHYYEARVAVSGPNEVLWIVQDVTERQRVAQELQASEDRLQSFFEATFEAVIIHDYDRILDVNPAAEELFGYSCEELVGMPVLNLAAGDWRRAIAQRWKTLSHPTDPYEYEAEGVRKDGSRFIGKVSAKVIHYRGTAVRVASIRDITLQREAEQAIRQSEARNRALLEAVPDLIFRIRRDGTYLDCKVGEYSTLMVSSDWLKGKKVSEVLPPALAAERMHYVHKALETGKIQSFEYQLSSDMIQQHPMLDQFYGSAGIESQPPIRDTALRDYEARVVVSGEDEVIAIVRDITARKRADQALRLSEEKFSKTFRFSPTPMTIATLLDGCLLEVNDGFLNTFGYSLDELVGHSVHEINFWVNPEQRKQMVKALQTEGSLRNLECQFRTKTGEIRDVLFSAEVIQIGDKPCLIDAMTDITERKRTEQQLWTAAERDRVIGEIALRIRKSLDLQTILDATVTEVHHFLQADRVCIGLGHGDGRSAGTIVAESAEPAWQGMRGVVLNDPQQLNELETLFSRGEAWMIPDTCQIQGYPALEAYYARNNVRAVLAVPLMIDDTFFGLLVVHQCSRPRQWQDSDVELLKQLAVQVSIAIQQAKLYQQVRELNADLERKVQERTAQLQQKMEELQELNELKDEFLNAFSHDLRTPVMGISLVINNLLNQPGETVSVSRMILERMVQSNQHQLQLIKSFLEAHSAEMRGVNLNPELVQLGLLVQVIVEDLEPIVDKNRATLENQVPPDLPLVNADPVQLRRVFENLVTNALNHNPPGVAIAIAASVEEDWIRFTIRDDGIGMAPETSQHLFERYSRGPKSRHSTGIGLGLYLCRQIVTAHGGQIGVSSEPGQGATFWLTLPLAIPTGANAMPDEEPCPESFAL